MSTTPDPGPMPGETTAPPADPTPASADAPATTEYVILSKDKTGYWSEQTTVNARGAEAAVRSWLDGASEPAGTYVAVPMRSWKPVTVSTETQTKIKLT